MKSFIPAVLLFCLLIGGTVWNYLYINDLSEDLTTQVDALSAFGSDSLLSECRKIQEVWEKNGIFAGLSVGYSVLDRVSEQAVSLSACAESGDYYGFCVARDLLKDALKDFRRLECFSAENLL